MSTFFPSSDKPGAASRAGSPSSKRRWVPRLLIGFAVLIALIGAGAVAYVGTLNHAVSSNLQRSSELPQEIPDSPDEAPRPAKAAKAKDAVNYVILGSDSRSANPGRGRSDVLMVLHLDGDRHGASLISFPRDMYVPIPGHGKNKINAAFAYGGTPLTIRTLEGLLKTRMDHAALIDFNGFIDLTDQLGGVSVNNPYASVSQGYNFPVGKVTIQGKQALAYVRERKQLPRGDLDRAERQRLVVQAVLRKGMSKDVMLNPVAFNRFVGGVASTVTVDQELSQSELRKTALSIRFSPDEIASIQAPISGFGTTSSGQSIDKVDQDKLDELVKALKNDDMERYVARYPAG